MEKIKVYTVEQVGGATLYGTSLEDVLSTLKYELEDMNEGDLQPFNFGVIYMTQEEIDSAGEFDGF